MDERELLLHIGIVALALTGAVAFPGCRDTGGSATSSEAAPIVKDYLEVADAAGAETTTVDEQFLAEALRKLAAALGTLNLGDLDLQVALRVAAEHVVLNPERADTTAAVRNSLISAAEAIEAGGTGGDAGLRQSAESLDPDRSLRDQTAAIREFLRKSGTALRPVAAR